ncbi:hypothetical protein EJB05_03562, partial [Eragrostis curvula]
MDGGCIFFSGGKRKREEEDDLISARGRGRPHRRWRHVRLYAPLNLDDRLHWHYSDGRRLEVVSQILAGHVAPARRLAFTSFHEPGSASRYKHWLPLPIFDEIQELVLHFPLAADHPRLLPASALRFASLRVLDIHNCTFPASDHARAFPCLLTRLSLRHVGVGEELLHGMISNSPGIEELTLGHRRLSLSSPPRLRCLAVLVRRFNRRDHEIELDELVIEDAPSLERLLLHEVEYGPSVRITGPATKLKMLRCLGTGFPVIELGTSIFKGMVPVSLADQFSTVTILGLHMPEPDLNVATGYLRCFPANLEKLHIKFFVNIWTTPPEDALICDPSSSAPIECLDRSLKTVVLQSYSGVPQHVEFARFFVERARVLEVIKFYCYCYSVSGCETSWLRSQRSRQLNVENSASRRAQVPVRAPVLLALKFLDGRRLL